MEPLFHAITAEEFKRILLKDLEKALDESGQFPPHITFPLVKWNFTLECVIVPRQAIDAPAELVVKGGSALLYDLKKDDVDPITVKFTQDDLIDTPDLARQEHGLPIPTPVRGPDGSLEDAMVLSTKAEKEETSVQVEVNPEPAVVLPPEPQEPISLAKPVPDAVLVEAAAAAAPVSGNKGQFARRTAIATKANPEGAKVDRKVKE